MIAAKTLIAATVATAALGAAPAFAKSCKDVQINMDNQSGQTIKIVDIDYQYGGRWGSEATPNFILHDDATASRERNLERARGETTRVWVEYKMHKPRGGWGRKVGVFSDAQTCANGAIFDVVLK